MGNGGPKLADKKDGVSLVWLAKELTPKELAQRLGIVYDKAIASVKKSLDVDALAYMKTAERMTLDLISLADFLDAVPTSFKVSVPNTKIDVRGNGFERYLARIEEIDKLGLDLTSHLRKIAGLITEAKADGVEITLKLTVKIKPNDEYLAQLSTYKQNFVENISKVVQGGLRGMPISAFSVDVGNEKAATVLAGALQKEIGIERPKGLKEETMIVFGEAKIPKGHYPLVAYVKGPKYTLEWPNWMERGILEMEFKEEEEKGSDLDFGRLKPKKTD